MYKKFRIKQLRKKNKSFLEWKDNDNKTKEIILTGKASWVRNLLPPIRGIEYKGVERVKSRTQKKVPQINHFEKFVGWIPIMVKPFNKIFKKQSLKTLVRRIVRCFIRTLIAISLRSNEKSISYLRIKKKATKGGETLVLSFFNLFLIFNGKGILDKSAIRRRDCNY